MSHAPIVIFAYNRPEFLKAVIDGLVKNEDASKSALYIFCDGAKNARDHEKVAALKKFARSVDGFKHVSVIERPINFGLSRSILGGVSEVCERHGSAIILEDDVVPNRHFLSYVNSALDKYADDRRVSSIGCYTFDTGFELPDTFFLRVPDCVGWAVWKRSWTEFEVDGRSLLKKLLAGGRRREFDFDGSYPYVQMLREQVRGYNQSWAVRWYAHVFLTGGLVLYPRWAVTRNIGLEDTSGTHGAAIDSYAPPRVADQPIVIADIPVKESIPGRAAWVSAFRKIRGGPARRLGYFVRSSFRLRSTFRRIRRLMLSKA
jgi:glycosyl transferase family 2